MATSRPIWKGSISFGLVMIPVTLFPSDLHNGLHFHLLDKRNNARIRYERINEETGKVVPWNMIAKAYEFEKGNYVVINEQELEKTAYENFDSIEIENFVEKSAIDALYFEKAYYLSPSKNGEKGYALLYKTLEATQKVGIAKIVIRSRQHLAAVLPYENILILNLMRFSEEIKNYKELNIPESNAKSYKISTKEVEMAERLVKSMSAKWNPKLYHDENRILLDRWIANKIKVGKSVLEPAKEKKGVKAGKVIDFMALLQKSIKVKEKGSSKSSAKKSSDMKEQPGLRESKKSGLKKNITHYSTKKSDNDHHFAHGKSKKKGSKK
jgi:DNA end-binding protein Ku